MKDKLNCPNCGAPITGARCEYCGTVFRQEETETVKLYANNEVVCEYNPRLEKLKKDLIARASYILEKAEMEKRGLTTDEMKEIAEIRDEVHHLNVYRRVANV